MKILKDCYPKNSALILGFFDGVHLGHRAVINSAVDYAKANGKKSVLVTFSRSPLEYFGGCVNYVYPRNISYEIISSLGVDYILLNDFNLFADMSAEEYLLNYLVKNFEPISISTGENHTFGKNKFGNPKFLLEYSKKLDYEYFEVPLVDFNSEIVSSSAVRNLLLSGNIQKASTFLGQNYFIESVVEHGLKIGRKIGFPTANMKYPNIVKIPYGVYQCKVLDKLAILNWGKRPTIDGNEELLEVHIPNYDEDLYGKILRVEILKKIRDEQKFNTLDDLTIQIEKDVKQCLEL